MNDPIYQRHAAGFRAWRTACGWTQKKAAENLLCSVETVSSIETGRLLISGRIALAAEAVSGVDAVSLMLGKPRAWWEQPDEVYSFRSLEEFRAMRQKAMIEHATRRQNV